MWDLIVSVPDHCLSFYFLQTSYLFLNLVGSWQNVTQTTPALPIYSPGETLSDKHYCLSEIVNSET